MKWKEEKLMLNIALFNQNGEKLNDLELNENVFGIEPNNQAIFDVVLLQRASLRQGTHKVKNRHEVSGGGKKPWRQKGTGRARQGSTRSPQWTGGGVVFAPKPRDYSFKLNKKVKRLALKSAFSTKVNDGKFVVVDEINLPEMKTKEMVKVLNNLNVNKSLVVLEDANEKAVVAARNIPTVKTASVSTINVYDILKYDSVVVTKAAVEKIEEVYA